MLLPISRRYRLEGLGPAAGSTPIVRRSMLNAIRSADRLLEAVKQRSASALEASRLEADRIVDEARSKAATVREKASIDAERLVWESARQLIDELERERDEMRASAQTMLAEIARAGLQRLMLDVPANWPSDSSVQLALQEWQAEHDPGKATLHVNPGDLETIAVSDAAARWQSVADPSVEQGNCVLSYGGAAARVSFSANVRSLVESMQENKELS